MGEILDQSEQYANWKAPEVSADAKIAQKNETEQSKGSDLTNADTVVPGVIDQPAAATVETESMESLSPQETRGRSFIERARDRLGQIDKDKAVQIAGAIALGGLVLTGMGESTILSGQYSHDLTSQSLITASGLGHMAVGLIGLSVVKGRREQL